MYSRTVRSTGALVAALSLSALSACGSSGGGSSKPSSISMVNSGGDFGTCIADTLWATYTKASGVKVKASGLIDDGQIQAAVKAKNYGADVVYPSPALAADKTGASYLEPIDFAKITKADLVPGSYTKYAVSQDLYSWVLGYRTDKFEGKSPASWADFFDTTAFPGKRALPGDVDVFAVVLAALMADGVKPADIVPIDVDRAIKKLDAIKSDIIWYKNGSQGQQLLQSGEVTMGMEYNNRVDAIKAAGKPVETQWNQQLLVGDLIAVPKGNPNKSEAMDLIASIVSPEVNSKQLKCAALAPSNTKAPVDAKNAKLLPTSHLQGDYLVETSPAVQNYLTDHKDEITTKFNDWRSK